MARKPHQPPLFELEPAPAANPAVLGTVESSDAPLGKAQRTFNRLTAAIRQQREGLAAWDVYLPQLQRRVMSGLVPVEREIREVQRRLALRLDVLLGNSDKGERLGQRQRACRP